MLDKMFIDRTEENEDRNLNSDIHTCTHALVQKLKQGRQQAKLV